MIEIKKLRIGEHEDKMIAGHKTEYLYGIPLGPEILEELGFVESPAKGGWYSLNNDIIDLSVNILDKSFCIANNEYEVVIKSNPINHLHQLKNLYLALTGTELEIENL